MQRVESNFSSLFRFPILYSTTQIMRNSFIISLIFSLFYISLVEAKPHEIAIDSTIQVDAIDIFKSIFLKNKKNRETNTFTPTKHSSFAILPSFNYSIATKFAAGANTVQTFKLNNDSITKESNIRTLSTYSQLKQFSSIISTNIWTKHNKINFLGDYRYYKFPSVTYGLGGNSSFDDANLVDYRHIRVFQVALRKVSKLFDVGIGYHLDYHWKIEEDNDDKVIITDLQKYGLSSNSTSSGLSLNLQHDSRTSSSTPMGGSYANVQYRYNVKFLGSDQNWQSLVFDLRKYARFPKESNNILAFWSYDWFTFGGNAPYFDLPSIGWDTYYNTGRGYPIGRFRGKNLVYFETEYRFGITRNGLLGAVVFCNAQSVTNYPNGGFSKIIPAGGGGLRVKLNKLNNTSLAFDYGFGIGGSRGFVFNINEVF